MLRMKMEKKNKISQKKTQQTVKNMKHFTVLELGSDAESPMIGTIDNVPNTPQGIDSFKERLMIALEEHFDSDDIHFLQEFPDMFTGSPYEDITISIDDIEYEIRILETWIY